MVRQNDSTASDRPPLAIGIDVGGTQIRVGVVDGLRVLAGMRRTPTASFSTANQLLDWLRCAINQLCDLHVCRSCVTSIGIGLPGVLDEQKGMLRRSINVSFLEGVALRDQLSNMTKYPVTLMTDADAATWGAYSQLSLPKPKRFVHLRLGTGIACGLVADGKIAPLPRIGGEHLRMLVVDKTASAIPCICGLSGCLETIASGKALLRIMEDRGLSPSVSAIQKGYERGDAWCREYGTQVASSIISALCSISRELRPEIISLGGGVGTHWPALIDTVLRDAEYAFDKLNLSIMPRIIKTPDDVECGVQGAAAFSLQAH